MKPSINRRLLFVTLAAASSASADLFWNPTPLDGNWDTTAVNWATTSGGTPTSAWVASESAIFDQAGTYTVTLTAAQIATALSVTNGTVTLAGSAVSTDSVNVGAGAILKTSGDRIGKTASPTPITVNGTLDLSSGGFSGLRYVQLAGAGTIIGGFRQSGSASFAGNIVDTTTPFARAAILWNGGTGGTLTLSGNNTGATGDVLLGIGGSVLKLASATAISNNAALRLEGGTGSTLVELAAADFTRTLSGGTTNLGGINLPTISTNAGFYATGADRALTFVTTVGGATPAAVTWGSGGIISSTIVLGATAATHKISWTNDINLGAVVRTVSVGNGAATVDAALTGVLSGTSAGGLRKTGSGTLELSAANTFAGAVQFNSAGSTATGFLRLSNNDALGPAATVKTIDLNASTGSATGGIELIGGVTITNKNINIGGRTPGERSFLINVSGNNSWGGNLTITNSGGGYFVSSLADTLTLTGTISNGVGGSTRGLELKGNGDYLITGPISNAAGTTALTKSGGGTATVSGAKTYTGATTVTGGILSLDSPYLSDASSVVIANSAVLNLTHGATDVVQALTLGGAVQQDGIYNSSTPGGFISGTGSIEVKANPFLVFVSGIANAADRDPKDDPDADGISNGAEFVIGGNPATGSDVALLPTQEFVTADLGAGSTDYLKFTFRRRDVAAYLNPSVEYDTDLTGAWTPATNGVSGVVIQTVDDGFATGVDRVDVFIPRSLAVDGRLFARLNVFVTP